MFKEYYKELKNLEVYEEENGFVLYRLQHPYLIIRDIYVKPEHRRSHLAANMADKLAKVAKELGFTHMLGDVEPSNNAATASIKVLLAYGMRVKEANQDEIIFIKEL
jgi:ribosomal protein S18 acetylase RimI-like enzyme